MKKQLLGFTTIVILNAMSLGAAQPSSVGSASKSTSSRGIEWKTNYEQAVTESEKTGKPIALFFTGSDWCTWCKKLEHEALDTREFANLVGDNLIFVKLDFPMHHPLEPRLARQNQQLRDKYDINGFPTLLVTDAKGRKVGTTGYQQGGGKLFGQHLLAMVNNYSKHRESVQDIAHENLSHDQLKKLYQEAKKLGNQDDTHKILAHGLKKDKDNFFLLEKYRFLVEEGEMYDKETLRLRGNLLSQRDADKLRRAHHDVAIIDFQALHHQMKRDHAHPSVAVAPLVDYVERFGPTDPENTWRMNMTISQVYLEEGDTAEALRYAKQAKSIAPSKVQKDIDKAVSYIKHQLDQKGS